jgi:hypothetical protein
MRNLFRSLTGLTISRRNDIKLVLEEKPHEHGTCSICGCQARRGSAGSWWHMEITDAMVCPQFGATFVTTASEPGSRFQ